WNKEGMKKRHVVVLWTDASTHPLGYGKKRANYPKNMAADFRELSSWWGIPGTDVGLMNQSAKRLLIFAPEREYWTMIRDHWDKVNYCNAIAGNGLAEQSYAEILNTIANTI
ncbi:MAG: VWA domain-containing protein, partial [Firmicutes bacterium]|nr:VWA domain-containing protein [Bacillota bacterium]